MHRIGVGDATGAGATKLWTKLWVEEGYAHCSVSDWHLSWIISCCRDSEYESAHWFASGSKK